MRKSNWIISPGFRGEILQIFELPPASLLISTGESFLIGAFNWQYFLTPPFIPFAVIHTPPETNSEFTPENGSTWNTSLSYWGPAAYFQGLCHVGFRVILIDFFSNTF